MVLLPLKLVQIQNKPSDLLKGTTFYFFLLREHKMSREYIFLVHWDTDEQVSEYGENNLNKQSKPLILVKYALTTVLEDN